MSKTCPVKIKILSWSIIIHHQSFDYMHMVLVEGTDSAIYATFGPRWRWPWIGSYGILSRISRQVKSEKLFVDGQTDGQTLRLSFLGRLGGVNLKTWNMTQTSLLQQWGIYNVKAFNWQYDRKQWFKYCTTGTKCVRQWENNYSISYTSSSRKFFTSSSDNNSPYDNRCTQQYNVRWR